MKLSLLVKKYPVLTYTIFCCIFGFVAFGMGNLGSYDDGSIGLFGLVLTLIWCVIAFPISISMEFFGFWYGLAAGLISLVVIESLVQWLRKTHA